MADDAVPAPIPGDEQSVEYIIESRRPAVEYMDGDDIDLDEDED